MQIIIEGDPKEFAALALELQKRQGEINAEELAESLADGFQAVCGDRQGIVGVVARNARRIIREKCLRQDLLAPKVGLHPKTFNALLNGRKIMREENITALAHALGVTPGELLDADYFSKNEAPIHE
ncbi:MAG: helix-turn-helix transcriptional regulator [Oscillospiraceae bacterium]|jgi:DNA-binding Xre family transcriptional regulator|nr:helix-turn-helix transcriptional regulator [Oscillospiraceae bacterium]